MDISLSDENELQVQSLLRFAKFKRDQHVKEIVQTIEDFQDMKVQPEEMYSTSDVQDFFGDLTAEIKDFAQKEIENAYHTNALLVKLLLSQAQQSSLQLHVETHQLENEYLLSQVKSSETTALSRSASEFTRRPTQLQKIGTVATVSVADPKVVKERDELKEELAALKERFQNLQVQTTAMMREKTALNDQVAELKEKLQRQVTQAQQLPPTTFQHEMAKVDVAGKEREDTLLQKVNKLQADLAGKSAELEECRQQLAATRKEEQKLSQEARRAEEALGGKVNDSKQFLQMKKMMQAKSQECTALRKRLAKYEPQDVPHADDSRPDPEFDD